MGIGAVSSIFSAALQGTGINLNNILKPASATAVSDSGQLSPVAKLMSTLQQLQSSNPAEYKKVAAQIATNLINAANTAQSQGYTTAASGLNQLAGDFTTASQTGQLPNFQNLGQALGGHHHHHHHFAPPTSEPGSPLTASATPSSSNSLISAFQSSSPQTDPFDPASIIANTLSSAGIGS